MKFFAVVFFLFFLQACAPNNVTVDNSFAPYFKEAGVEGCAALLDNGNGEFTVYNLGRYRDSSVAPGAMFSLVTALAGLQTGVIAGDSTRNGSGKNLYTALKTGDEIYFTEVAQRLGRDTLQHFLDTLSYGTRKIKTSLDSFWRDGSLRLTPDEQLGFVKRLYFGQLPFFKLHQEMVKRALVQEQNTAYTLAFKTGAAVWDASRKKRIAWVGGWVERDRQPRFFVLTVESANPALDLQTAGTVVLKRILQQLGLLQTKSGA